MQCCGKDSQVIELRGGTEPLRLVRCPTCEHRSWQLGAQTVAADEAFAVLALTYRTLPRQARAARERTATQAAARAAARAARAAAAPAPAPARDDLTALLQGWTVLGASA